MTDGVARHFSASRPSYSPPDPIGRAEIVYGLAGLVSIGQVRVPWRFLRESGDRVSMKGLMLSQNRSVSNPSALRSASDLTTWEDGSPSVTRSRANHDMPQARPIRALPVASTRFFLAGLSE